MWSTEAFSLSPHTLLRHGLGEKMFGKEILQTGLLDLGFSLYSSLMLLLKADMEVGNVEHQGLSPYTLFETWLGGKNVLQ